MFLWKILFIYDNKLFLDVRLHWDVGDHDILTTLEPSESVLLKPAQSNVLYDYI